MRIDRLRVKNFRGFEDREFIFAGSPSNGSFHLLIGDNATGKTGVLEAIAVALGSYTNVMPEAGKRHFQKRDIRVLLQAVGDTERIEPQLPTEIVAEGHVEAKPIKWTRRLKNKRVERAADKAMREYAQSALTRGRKDMSAVLPVICYFGTERLHRHPKDVWSRDASFGETLIPKPVRKEGARLYYEDKQFAQSRFVGYWFANDARTSPELLQRWLMVEHDLNRDRGFEAIQFQVVKEAMQQCIVNCSGIKLDARLGLLVNIQNRGWLPFELLSDGQKVIAAMVGELAWKASQLNPILNREVLTKSPGIVLIDELDLHLHPVWQRTIVEALRTIFPRMQFICTTHSPFIVQTMREGELMSLDKETIPKTDNLSIAAIAKGLMGVEEISERIMGVMEPDASPRYNKMKQVATDYLIELQEAKKAPAEKLEEYKRALAERIAPYADNPAFQAVLEMERITALGS